VFSHETRSDRLGTGGAEIVVDLPAVYQAEDAKTLRGGVKKVLISARPNEDTTIVLAQRENRVGPRITSFQTPSCTTTVGTVARVIHQKLATVRPDNDHSFLTKTQLLRLAAKTCAARPLLFQDSTQQAAKAVALVLPG